MAGVIAAGIARHHPQRHDRLHWHELPPVAADTRGGQRCERPRCGSQLRRGEVEADSRRHWPEVCQWNVPAEGATEYT